MQVLLIQTGHRSLSFGSALGRPRVGEGHAQVRVKPSEERLAYGRCEHAFEATVARVSWPQAISVSHQAGQAIPCANDGLTVDVHSQFFLEVTKRPHVVVSDVKMNGQAGVREFGDGAHQANATLGHSTLVFKPKIEQVSHQVEFGRLSSFCKS